MVDHPRKQENNKISIHNVVPLWLPFSTPKRGSSKTHTAFMEALCKWWELIAYTKAYTIQWLISFCTRLQVLLPNAPHLLLVGQSKTNQEKRSDRNGKEAGNHGCCLSVGRFSTSEQNPVLVFWRGGPNIFLPSGTLILYGNTFGDLAEKKPGLG